MRVLANENLPGAVVRALKDRGHDVVWIRAVAPGSSDSAVIERAQFEDRVLLTFDKDFGELAFRSGLSPKSGIVLFRFAPIVPNRLASLIVSALESRSDWSGNFSVIEADRIRITPLPQKTA